MSADQQRLLLAGAGLAGRQAARRIQQRHVGAVRAERRGPSRGIARRWRPPGRRAASPPPPAPGLGASRSAIGQDSAICAAGKPPTRVAIEAFSRATSAARDAVAATACRAIGPPARQARRGRRSLPPAGGCGWPWRPSCAAISRACAGLQRADQPVQEAAAAGGAFLEQPVHLRGEPDRGNPGGDLRLAARRGAVQAEHAPLRRTLRRGAGADLHLAGRRGETRGNGPGGAARATPRQLADARTAQAAARHQQRYRLQQIGLAAAVRAEDRDNARRRPPGQVGVAAEIRQVQTPEAKRAHGGRPGGFAPWTPSKGQSSLASLGWVCRRGGIPCCCNRSVGSAPSSTNPSKGS